MTVRTIQRTLAVSAATLLISACSSSESDNTPLQTQSDSVIEADAQIGRDENTAAITPVNTPLNDAVESPADTTGPEEPDPETIDPETTELVTTEPDETNPTATTVLNSDNANAVILQAFEVLSGRAYDRRLSAYPYVRRAPPLDPLNNALGEHLYLETLACDIGGEKTENVYADSQGFDGFTFYDTTYANCSVQGDVLNGRAVLSGDTCCGHGYQTEFTNDFSVTFGNDGRMDLSGIYKNLEFVSVEDFDFDITFSGGSLSVTDATTVRARDHLSGSFRMTPPVLNNQNVSVSIDNAFINIEDEDDSYNYFYNTRYEQGSMRITADDSDIVLEADNGDVDTVTITVTAGGETVTRTESWSNWFSALSFIAPTLGGDVNPVSPDGDGTLLNADSYSQILSEVFSVMTGDRLSHEAVSNHNYVYPEFPYEEVNDINGFGEERILTCDNGGTATLRPFRWGFRQLTSGWRAEFDNCDQAGVNYNGRISELDTGARTNFSWGMTQSDGVSNSTFSGLVKYKTVERRSDGIPWFEVDFQDVYLDSTDANDAFVISDADFRYVASYDFRTEGFMSYTSLKGRFSLSSNATNHNTIEVRIPEELLLLHPESVFSDVVTPSSELGVLYINAGNGNELFLKAATGNSETFTVDIYQPGQAPIRVTEQWRDWGSLFGFNFDLVDR